MGKGTVNRYFETKDALDSAVLLIGLENFIEAALDALYEEDAWGGFRTLMREEITAKVNNASFGMAGKIEAESDVLMDNAKAESDEDRHRRD